MYLKKSHTNETNVEAFLSCRDYSNLVCTGLFNNFSLQLLDAHSEV